MAVFPKGISTGAAGVAKSQAVSKGGGKFTTNLFWRADDKRYIQFVTEFEDMPTVPYYSVCIGRKNGKAWMENFVDPQAWFGEDAYNGLKDLGWYPKLRQVAVAVEVEPVMGTVGGRKKAIGFEPKMRSFKRKTGEEVSVPNVGVIANSHIFFGFLKTYHEDTGSITDAVFAITRRGGDQNTAYDFVPQKGEPIELTEAILNEIDLATYLTELADPERMRAVVESLPADWEYDFSKRGSKSEVKDEPAVNHDYTADEAGTTEPDEQDPAKARAEDFEKLKARLN